MRKWVGALILTFPALSACSSDVTVAEHDELGDIVAGHITVPSMG